MSIAVAPRHLQLLHETPQGDSLMQAELGGNESDTEGEVPISPKLMKVMEKIPLRKCALTKLKNFQRFLGRSGDYYSGAVKLSERNTKAKAKFQMDSVFIEEGSVEFTRGCDNGTVFMDCVSHMVASDWMMLIDSYEDVLDVRNVKASKNSRDNFPGPVNENDNYDLTETKKNILKMR